MSTLLRVLVHVFAPVRGRGALIDGLGFGACPRSAAVAHTRADVAGAASRALHAREGRASLAA